MSNITKNKIIDYASEKFFRDGYKSIRIDSIASELSISKSTLYKYFKSKDDLIEYIVKNKILMINNNMIKILNDDENKDFIKILNQIWQLIHKHINFFTTQVLSDLKSNTPDLFNECQRWDQERKEIFLDVYDLGVEQGYIKPEIDKEIFYLIHFHSIKNLMQLDVMIQLPLSSEQIIDNINEVLFKGILTNKGQEKLKIMFSNN